MEGAKPRAVTPAALIFSHSTTPRLRYMAEFLSYYYGFPFRITSDPDAFAKTAEACRINYSQKQISPGEIFLHAHGLLSELYIRPLKVECFEKKNGDGVASYPAFFKSEGDMGFDLFAAIFFLISRYEEYLPHRKDSYGRFAHEQSLAFVHDFLHLPLVNIWLEDFRSLLSAREPAFAKRKEVFRFVPTYDIDMAWSFRNKGFVLNAGALLLLSLRAQFGRAAQRLQVIRKKALDPYDAYEWMEALHERHGLQPLYFFLVAGRRGRFDKNIDPSHPEFKNLLARLAHHTIGLHPSWASGDLPALLTKEKRMLEKLTGKPVHTSRQHFIRFELPLTYERLLALDLVHDHSMGYGSINGFRASIAHPFFWYNLKSETSTSLLLHPFCFMDANAYYEQQLSPEEAAAELRRLANAVRAVNGQMITIWHNSFLGTAPEFAGWKEVYEKFVAEVNR